MTTTATTTVKNAASVAAISLASFVDNAESVTVKSILLGAWHVVKMIARTSIELLSAVLVLCVVLIAKVVNPTRRMVAWLMKNGTNIPALYRMELRVMFSFFVWTGRHKVITTCFFVVFESYCLYRALMY